MKWIDLNGLEQQDLAKNANVSKNTVTKACGDKDYIPRQYFMKKLFKTVRKVDPNLKMSDFWDM